MWMKISIYLDEVAALNLVSEYVTRFNSVGYNGRNNLARDMVELGLLWKPFPHSPSNRIITHP